MSKTASGKFPKNIEINVEPGFETDEQLIGELLKKALGSRFTRLQVWKINRRSLDARKQPVFRLLIDLFFDEAPPELPAIIASYKEVRQSPEVLIIGAGPAGYFAALECLELGLKPIVLDRGKDVRARRRDLKAIQQDGIVNPHSNYCFGEGGAGTYSDGKLYTRSHKRGDVEKTLRLLVEHGAKSDILIDAHPHIGSNKLPGIIENIRQSIIRFGGEVHFDSWVTDFEIEDQQIRGVVVNGERRFPANRLILATGHSARDIYKMLSQKSIKIEAKPFALGVRIEHPQELIDSIQYKLTGARPDTLPASSYKLACTLNNRGVFSFCMCPGGLIVPAATAPGEIVINGMSMSRRDSKFANSGMVAAVNLEHLEPYRDYGPLAGMEFQREVEQAMFAAGDGSQKAPTQRLTDFMKQRKSTVLNDTSYLPGLFSAPLHELLPRDIVDAMQNAFRQFKKTMPRYITEEANLVATESRTSSPVRIPRDKLTFMHPEVFGLFPCGEGAGYAGGILSAAMDGANVAHAVYKSIQ